MPDRFDGETPEREDEDRALALRPDRCLTCHGTGEILLEIDGETTSLRCAACKGTGRDRGRRRRLGRLLPRLGITARRRKVRGGGRGRAPRMSPWPPLSRGHEEALFPGVPHDLDRPPGLCLMGQSPVLPPKPKPEQEELDGSEQPETAVMGLPATGEVTFGVAPEFGPLEVGVAPAEVEAQIAGGGLPGTGIGPAASFEMTASLEGVPGLHPDIDYDVTGLTPPALPGGLVYEAPPEFDVPPV